MISQPLANSKNIILVQQICAASCPHLFNCEEMGVSGNFLAVALPGLTKHSPSQNLVNFRACYPIIEKKDGGGPLNKVGHFRAPVLPANF